MPEITHHTRSLRIAPRKVRLVVDKIRHLTTEKALEMLPLMPQKSGTDVYKAVKAAVEMAKDANLDPATLVIQRAWADEGKALKRMVKHGRGRSSMIMKKYSHLGLVLKGEEKRARRSKAIKSTELPAEVTEVSAEQPAVTGEQE